MVGDVRGQCVEVLKKISTLHAKNAFSFAIVAGDLFADPPTDAESNESALDDLLNGRVQVPLPTYFALGRQPLPAKVIKKLESNSGELCENLMFLGKRTTIKTSEGLRIVVLGGALDPNLTIAASGDLYTPFHSTGDANALKGANSADILVTAEWPEGITKGSRTINENVTPTSPQKTVADLCTALKPKYHFSTSADGFYEREPFLHTPDEGSDPNDDHKITRFISLAPYGNTAKQKWIYAFSIDPGASDPVTIPEGMTASPLTAPKKRTVDKQDSQAYGRYADANAYSYSDSRSNKRRKGQGRQPPPGPGECFFCLSNPNLSTHLITSIGDHAYMTTAKGPLTTSDTFSQYKLEVPGHMLIIPLAHSAIIESITDSQSRQDTLEEMKRFKSSVQQMISTVSNGKLGAVTWEVCRSQGIHTHWQILPVPIDLIQRGLVEAAFKVEAENEHYPPFEITNKDTEESFGDRFDVWMWVASTAKPDTNGHLDEKEDAEQTRIEKKMSLPLSSDFRFDLQFGRRVMAKLLGLEKRVQWRDCAQSTEDETGEAERWKAIFKDFDFTVEK